MKNKKITQLNFLLMSARRHYSLRIPKEEIVYFSFFKYKIICHEI